MLKQTQNYDHMELEKKNQKTHLPHIEGQFY